MEVQGVQPIGEAAVLSERMRNEALEGIIKRTMVCVKNSTLEPDDSRKEYYLRVPPDIHTAKGAVAWTFGLDADEYEPEFES